MRCHPKGKLIGYARIGSFSFSNIKIIVVMVYSSIYNNSRGINNILWLSK